jgi:Protein of unknown function (DUF1565)
MRTGKSFASLLIIAAVLALTHPAQSGTIYVANNGVDGPICHPTLTLLGEDCGTKTKPCRTITCGVGNALTGDTVMVGPGTYSDQTGETPSPGCGCMMSITKPVIVLSSHGAASTVIDGSSSGAIATVLLITVNGGEFGRPGQGFSVSHTNNSTSRRGIEIDTIGLRVRGNQVIARPQGPVGSAVESSRGTSQGPFSSRETR